MSEFIVVQPEMKPRLPTAPVKSASGPPDDMPCADAVVKTPACVTDEIAIAVPVPSTQYGVPTVGPTIIVPSDLNVNGLPIVSECAMDAVMIAVGTVLTVIKSATAAGFDGAGMVTLV